jgi:hypothetical protein
MWGTVLTAAVIFGILFVVSRAAGYYRRRWSVADSTVTGGDDVTVSAAIGIGSGVVVLLLLLLLYLGVTRWDWAGHPVGGTHTISTPAPISSPGSNPVVNPSAGAPGASPSAKTSP